MNKANFEFNMNQTNPWVNMTSGAKVASVIAGPEGRIFLVYLHLCTK